MYEKGMVIFCTCYRYEISDKQIFFLPHQCDEWAIGGIEEAEAFIIDLQEILDRVKSKKLTMTKKTIQVDSAFILQIARSYDTLKKRVDHLESRIKIPGDYSCSVIFDHLVSPQQQKAYLNQFCAEIMSIFKEYGVDHFEGVYGKQ